PLAPCRQRRDNGVALHVVARGLPDLVLRGSDVVHRVPDHDAKAILVKPAKLHLSPLADSSCEDSSACIAFLDAFDLNDQIGPTLSKIWHAVAGRCGILLG